MNIELTFKSGYSFDCTNCGICCRYVGGISLTSRERDSFGRSLDTNQFSTVNHAAFPYLLANDPECRYLKDGKCIIHGSHPLFCRLYPLSFGSHKDAVFVNLIHCEGVNSENIGSKVDLKFAKQTIDEMVRLEGEEFPRVFLSEEGHLTEGRMPLYKNGAQTFYSDFSNRRRLLLNFAEWVVNPSVERTLIGSQRLQAALLGPFASLKSTIIQETKQRDGEPIDIGTALNQVSKNLSLHLSRGSAEFLEAEKKRDHRMQVFDPFTNSARFIDPKGEIELIDYYDKPVRLPVSVASNPASLETKALELELSYIQEILGRVGMGGVPYYLPIDVGIERLQGVIQGLEVYSKYLAYKDGKDEVSASMMIESIRNTDTRIMDLLVV